MHLKLTNEHPPHADVLCDFCNLTIELDEDCTYLFSDNKRPVLDSLLVHNACFRRAPRERLAGYWATLTRPRDILESIVKTPRRNGKYRQLDALLNDIEEQRRRADRTSANRMSDPE